MENGKKIKPGFIGNIILGAAGGFVLYAFVAQELAGIKQIALVFLGGIGGGNVLISFLQKHKIGVEERRTEGFEKLAKEHEAMEEKKKKEILDYMEKLKKADSVKEIRVPLQKVIMKNRFL